MAGWYIRRGEKVVGPADTDKLKELVATGKLLPTDQLAKDAGGPWTQAARTSLFANAHVNNLAVAPPQPPAKQPVSAPVIVESIPQPEQQPLAYAESGNVTTAAKGGLSALSSAGGAVARSFAERSKRKHELKLAKIQAQAVQATQQSAPAPQYSHAAPPPPQQAVNVNVVQQVNFVGGNRKRWSRLVAMILSVIIPGLGQLYKGQPINGLVWFVLTVGGYVFFIIPGIVLHCLCILGAAMGDPYR